MERWRDRKEGDGSEDRAGSLFRSVRPHDPSPELEERVQAVLRGDDVPSRLRRPIPALAAIAVFLAVAGGATAATMIVQSWVEPEQKIVEPKKRSVKKIVLPAPVPPPPVEIIAPEPPRPPKPTTSELALESKRIKAAVEAQRNGNPQRALEEIAAYERQHPNGVLRKEATLTKVSALIALHRHDEALAILDRTEIDVRSIELTILRGELRARADRCADAIADFESALSRDPEENLRLRAEKGLARCRN